MTSGDGIAITALTLILANQIKAECIASGRAANGDFVAEAIALIKEQRGIILPRYGVHVI